MAQTSQILAGLPFKAPLEKAALEGTEPPPLLPDAPRLMAPVFEAFRVLRDKTLLIDRRRQDLQEIIAVNTEETFADAFALRIAYAHDPAIARDMALAALALTERRKLRAQAAANDGGRLAPSRQPA